MQVSIYSSCLPRTLKSQIKPSNSPSLLLALCRHPSTDVTMRKHSHTSLCLQQAEQAISSNLRQTDTRRTRNSNQQVSHQLTSRWIPSKPTTSSRRLVDGLHCAGVTGKRWGAVRVTGDSTC